MKKIGLALFLSLSGLSAATAASPVRDYVPDYTFTGSRLANWRPVGSVVWTAADGEIVATPRAGGGGLLVLDKLLQDVAAYTQFQCADPCAGGLLLRAERTATGGLKGYLAGLGSGPLEVSEVTFDADGKEIGRRKLGAAGSPFARFAPPAGGQPAGAAPSVPGIVPPKGDTPAPPLVADIIPIGGAAESAVPPPPRAAGGGRGPGGGPGGGGAPILNFRPGQWNEINVLIDANKMTSKVNGANGGSGSTFDEAQSAGSVALYLAPGSGSIRFKTTSYKDVGHQRVPLERISPNFRMQKLDDFDYAWDSAVADVTHDGVNDIIAGPYYYVGPKFVERREIYLANTFAPGNQFADNMITFAGDYTGDGWPDVLATELRQLVLYVNPQNAARRWQRHVIAPGITSEIVLSADLDKDGTPELIFVQEGKIAFAKAKRSDSTTPWPVFFVSDAGMGGIHGLGVGDINGDGRPDILNNKGWWEHPAAGLTAKWVFHDTPFNDPSREPSGGGGEMSVADVNADGLNDVVTSINAHGYGLGWFQQKRSSTGNITFEYRAIMGDNTNTNPGNLAISELHAGAIAVDMNRDGVVDIVTGKRRWAHLDSNLDADPNGPSYLVWYKGVRDAKAPGGVRFTPEVIHNRSGVGSALTVTDVDKDGAPDVVTSTVHGTFVFFNRLARGGKK